MNKTVFRTTRKIDRTFLLLYSGLYLFLMGIAFYSYIKEKDVNVLLAMGAVCGFLLLLSILTYNYLKVIIDGHFLIVKYFFVVYKADIRNITKIRKGETMWSGFHKYGTVTKGLILFVKYKNDLYITPENEELFYQKILEINPDVVIEKVD